MPELPEVEAFKSYVQKKCLHKTIASVEILDPKAIKGATVSAFAKQIHKASFSAVERKGKYLIISLKGSSKKVVMHFGLTGFLVVAPRDKVVRFSQVIFNFNANGALHWCDVRKFGKVWLVDSVDDIAGIEQLGPDALALSVADFMNIAHENATKNIKVFLMDQSIIAGIGNEYSDEILFQAGIDPRHKIKDLSTVLLKKIYQEMKKVLKYAIGVREKSLPLLSQHRLFSADDSQVFKSSYLQAHRHTDMRCPKHKEHMLKRITIGGRSAYYCPQDQH